MNPYQILGIKESASADEVKAAYIKAARKCHPDMGGNEIAMSAINKAYEEITCELAQVQSQPKVEPSQPQKSEQQWLTIYWKLAGNSSAILTARRKEWLTSQLEAIEPPQYIWELHGKESGYKPEWAELKYLLQQKIKEKENANPQ